MSGFSLLPRALGSTRGKKSETNYAKSLKTLLTADRVSLVCHSGVRMKQSTASYFKIEIGRLYSNYLEEIHFRKVEWIELTRDEVSNFETWQWIPGVLCTVRWPRKLSISTVYKSTARKLSMGILHLINWSRKMSLCNVYLNNHKRSPWAFLLNQFVNKSLCVHCIKSPIELFVGIVLKYCTINWSMMFPLNTVCTLK
jgi:hypothetical protein